MASNRFLVLLAFGLFIHSIQALTCYVGDEEQTVVSDEEFEYCVRTKMALEKKLSYSGTNTTTNLSRGNCLIQFDFKKSVLNINCYCKENKCNYPQPFDPKY